MDAAAATIQTCVAEIARAAQEFGATTVTAKAGRVTPRRNGVRRTIMSVEVHYPGQIRHTVVMCELDAEGNVTISEVPPEPPADAPALPPRSR